jgi:hypothetical protein
VEYSQMRNCGKRPCAKRWEHGKRKNGEIE